MPQVWHLDWSQIFHMFCCCCKRKWYKDYREAIDRVEVDLGRQLDLVNMMKKDRAFGITLTALIDSNTRSLIETKSRSQAIATIDPVKDKFKRPWQ